MENRKQVDESKLEEKERADMRENEALALFLSTEQFLCNEGNAEIDANAEKRSPCPIVPIMQPTRLVDRDQNKIYVCVAVVK